MVCLHLYAELFLRKSKEICLMHFCAPRSDLQDITLQGWCPAGSVLLHGEKVPLKPWLATLLLMMSQ